MLKKLISTLLCLAMLIPCFTLTGFTVSAEKESMPTEQNKATATYSGSCGENVTWALDTAKKILYINGTGEMDFYGITNSGGVSSPWYEYRYYIKSLFVADGITSIGQCSFYGCIYLEDITLPDSVIQISSLAFYNTAYYNEDANWENGVLYLGNHLIQAKTSIRGPYTVKTGTKGIALSAFEGCTALTSITIPDSVTYIGPFAFEDCTSLKTINIGGYVTEMGQSAFYNTAYYNNSANWSNNMLYIGDYLLHVKPTATGSCYVWSGTKCIARFAFYSCSGLTDVYLPDSLTAIGYSAFSNCSTLTKITIPDSVTVMGDRVFEDCTSLTSVVIGASVTEIGDYTFNKCSSLVSVAIPDSLSAIGKYAFNECTSLVTADIHAGISEIGEYAFYNCKNLTSNIVIGDNVKAIGKATFYNCQSLTDIIIGSSVTTIGEDAFQYCYSLTSVTIPDSVLTIEEDAFYDCRSLESISFGSGLTGIGDFAFSNNDSLKAIHMPDSLESIGKGAFYFCDSVTELTLPSSVTYIGESAFYSCKALTSVTIPGSLTDISNNLFENCSSLTNVSIPVSVKKIGDYAFANCDMLYAITVPNSVTTIGAYAFSGCLSLADVVIGNSVTTIGDYAFFHCSSLKNIILPDSVSVLGENVFGSSSLESVTLSRALTEISKTAFFGCELTEIVIPTSVTTIGEKAFGFCPLTSVDIPNSVTSIGAYAFTSCNDLVTITIPRSVTSIGDSAFHDYYTPTWKLNVTIRCYEDSYAHSYALDNNFSFELIHECKFTSYLSDNNATCTEDGTKTAICDVEGCDLTNTVTDYGSALGHLFTEYVEYTEPTCTKNATGYSECERGCGISGVVEIYGTALGHSFTEYIEYTEATCTKDATERSGCDRCDATNVRSVEGSALGHSFTEYAVLTEATCTKDATSVSYCDRGCGAADVITMEGTATGHTEGDWVTVKEPTKDSEGLARICCISCGITLDEQVLEKLPSSDFDRGELAEEMTWRIDGDYVLHIEGNGAMPDLSAKEDYPWYSHRYKILAVDIADGITHIGNYALSYLPKVTTLIIPDSVKTIGLRAFRYTEGMTEVHIGSGVEFIDEYAFQNCHALTDVYIKDIVAWCNIDFANQNSTPMNLAKNLYLNVELITELTVPEGVETIGNYAFINCDKITKLTLSNGLKTISKKAFTNCYALTEAYIPASVTSIDASVFNNCSELTISCHKGSYAEKFAVDNSIPYTTVDDDPKVTGVENYTVTLKNITDIKEIRFAVGTYTTGSEIKAAEKNVTLDKATVNKYTTDGTFKYDLPWVGTYTFWVRCNDGSQYFLYTNVTEINPYITSYGVKLTVNDFGENYKDAWLAKGTFNSYSEIKKSTEFKYQASATKLDNYAKTTHDFTYVMEDPGDYTVLIRYNDGSVDVIHHTLTVDYPVLVENGLQAIITNIPDIKIIRTAYGHYTDVAGIKKASTVRYFNNKTAIKDAEEYMIQYREEGEVTIIVEYNNGYKHYIYYNVQKKVPTYTLEGDTITFGNLDDLYIIRYAPGKYTTANNIKKAPGAQYKKTADINENGEIVISGLTTGRWSFMVQYNDDSYNFYLLDIE